LEKRFRETLNSNITTIRETLLDKIQTKFDKIREEKLDIEDVKAFNKQKEDINQEIENKRSIMTKKINELHDEFNIYTEEQDKIIDDIQINIDKKLPLVCERESYDDSISDKARI
jgi:hypothetical protein